MRMQQASIPNAQGLRWAIYMSDVDFNLLAKKDKATIQAVCEMAKRRVERASRDGL